MTKKYEKTQSGNPHQLTVWQHCFPKKSIERFTNEDGRVHVHIIEHNKTETLTPDNNIFCARRSWDQRAETGFMKEVEDAYQELADKIAAGNVDRPLKLEENCVVTDMFLLWLYRWVYCNNPLEDQPIKSASGVTHNYSKDVQERLEKRGFISIKPDLTISGRHFTGINIQLEIINGRKHMKDFSWCILNCREVEFVVPDNPAHFVLPVTPNVCLVREVGCQPVSTHTIAELNERVKEKSEKYYFGRSL